MGKASSAKRKRASVRSAKRSRTNTWWYGLTAIVVIAGVSLIVYAKQTAPAPVGPFLADASNPTKKDTHWHAALGVYDCDHWMGDTPGSGIWQWKYATPSGTPARASDTSQYAGLHSHDDGVIHMEPASSEEAGRNATVGRYFDFGGWKISATSFDFLGLTHVWGRSRNGRDMVRQVTAKGRFARAVAAVSDWCRKHRHWSLRDQHRHLSSMMRGHFAYYGVGGNSRRLRWFANQVGRVWRKWLSRRDRQGVVQWARFNELLARHPLPPVRILHGYATASESLS